MLILQCLFEDSDRNEDILIEDLICYPYPDMFSCINNPLCKWNSSSLNRLKCQLNPCADQTNCDLSVCRLVGSPPTCTSCSSLTTPSDCITNSCCWYEGKCNNIQAYFCDAYKTEDSCAIGTVNSICYWDVNKCDIIATSCSSYLSQIECTNKIIIGGNKCYWYNSICNSAKPSDCSTYLETECYQGSPGATKKWNVLLL